MSGKEQYSSVRTHTFTKTILQHCDTQRDEWSSQVRGRIEYYHSDLYAAKCVYHHQCNSHFRCGRDMPIQFQNKNDIKRKKCGKPKDDDQEQAFFKMCQFLEANDKYQLTVSDLKYKMMDYLSHADSQPYSNYYLKMQLQENYGDAIHIAEGEGVDSIVTMREKTSDILRNYYKSLRKDDDEDLQKNAILEAAARIIKSDIKTNIQPVSNHYPTSEDIKLH